MSKKKDKSLIKKGRKKIKTNLLRRQLLRVKVRDDGHIGGLVRLSVKEGREGERERERVSEVGGGGDERGREEVEKTNVVDVAAAGVFFFSGVSSSSTKTNLERRPEERAQSPLGRDTCSSSIVAPAAAAAVRGGRRARG